ncbi:MAG: hypothetical protein ACT4OY_00485 [Alphaproteobacteria bacterium]
MILDSRILWSLLKTESVTVSVTRRPAKTFLLFQVTQMTDLGRGRPQIFLRSINYKAESLRQCAVTVKKSALSLPGKIGNVGVTYAGLACKPISDVSEAIVWIKGKACIEKIVPDVLVPGDFVVFKTVKDGQVLFVEALRAMTVKQLMNHKPSRIAHAL